MSGTLDATKEPAVVMMCKNLRSDYEEKERGAGSFDLELFLPKAHTAVFGHPKWSPMEKQATWSALLNSFPLMARRSEMSASCPEIQDLKTPTDPRLTDAGDGLPLYLEAQLITWKRRTSKIPWTFKINRNRCNVMCCPMIQLLIFLRMSGLTRGPILPRFDRGIPVQAVGRQVFTATTGHKRTFWVDANGKAVNMSKDMWASRLKEIFKLSGYPQCTSHSIRKSAVKWAIRVGAKEYEVLNAGRWRLGSPWFQDYVQRGKTEKADAESMNGGTDPIFKFWIFKPITRHIAVAPELMGTRGQTA